MMGKHGKGIAPNGHSQYFANDTVWAVQLQFAITDTHAESDICSISVTVSEYYFSRECHLMFPSQFFLSFIIITSSTA